MCPPKREMVQFILVLFQENRDLKGYYNIFSSSDVQCQECPYGASCSLGHVSAIYNYWGYVTKSENGTPDVTMIECPDGYCCQDDVNKEFKAMFRIEMSRFSPMLQTRGLAEITTLSTIIHWHFFRLPRKLREGIVFTGVCPSVHRRVM